MADLGCMISDLFLAVSCALSFAPLILNFSFLFLVACSLPLLPFSLFLRYEEPNTNC
jgi:hypothetical protein